MKFLNRHFIYELLFIFFCFVLASKMLKINALTKFFEQSGIKLAGARDLHLLVDCVKISQANLDSNRCCTCCCNKLWIETAML